MREDSRKVFRKVVMSSGLVNISVLSDVLQLGALGFAAGVLLPWAFRLIAYLVDVMRVVVE